MCAFAQILELNLFRKNKQNSSNYKSNIEVDFDLSDVHYLLNNINIRKLWIFVIICTKRSNNVNKIAINDKSCGQFQQMRAEDGKLKFNLEWPTAMHPVSDFEGRVSFDACENIGNCTYHGITYSYLLNTH